MSDSKKTLLEDLKSSTIVVADTGELAFIKKHKPQDATTNPSLLLKVSNMPDYKDLVDDALQYGAKHGDTEDEKVTNAMDKMAVNFGTEITKLISGLVSTEVDSRLSFDTQATVDKARKLIQMYKENGVDKDRILIKIASTWEGFQAAKILESEGIHVNMTLLFSFAQAQVAASSGVTLISPFVGRILDWYKAKEKKDYAAEDDPGVVSVRKIYRYYKKNGFKTVVMGASFRNIGEILELAGCDKLTISPQLLDELSSKTGSVPRKLSPDDDFKGIPDAVELTESQFRWELNEDAMATEKLAEGIRKFAEDTVTLEKRVREFMRTPSS